MKTVLIKCGGSTLKQLSANFYSSLKELQRQDYSIVIVHGGGPDINNMLTKLKVDVEYVNGLRRTNEATLHIVEMVLSGKTNRELVQSLTKNGLNAIGLNGSDAQLLKGEFIDKERLGHVGEITEVNSSLIQLLLSEGIIPVITPIAVSEDGGKLNVNADYAAAAVAKALKVEQCLFVTDVEGIMIAGEVIHSIGKDAIQHYVESGEIYGGMIPKVVSALSAIEKGIESVRIVSGDRGFFQHNQWMGTKIMGKEKVI